MKFLEIFLIIKKPYSYVKYKIQKEKYKAKWRAENSNNFTKKDGWYPDIFTVGNYTYGKINSTYFGNKKEKIEIGNFCSIAGDVLFLTGGGT